MNRVEQSVWTELVDTYYNVKGPGRASRIADVLDDFFRHASLKGFSARENNAADDLLTSHEQEGGKKTEMELDKFMKVIAPRLKKMGLDESKETESDSLVEATSRYMNTESFKNYLGYSDKATGDTKFKVGDWIQDVHHHNVHQIHKIAGTTLYTIEYRKNGRIKDSNSNVHVTKATKIEKPSYIKEELDEALDQKLVSLTSQYLEAYVKEVKRRSFDYSASSKILKKIYQEYGDAASARVLKQGYDAANRILRNVKEEQRS